MGDIISLGSSTPCHKALRHGPQGMLLGLGCQGCKATEQYGHPMQYLQEVMSAAAQLGWMPACQLVM